MARGAGLVTCAWYRLDPGGDAMLGWLLGVGVGWAADPCPVGQAPCPDGAAGCCPAEARPSLTPLVLVPAGVFTMGTKDGEAGRERDELPHRVRLSRPLAVMKTEVTQGLYQSVMGTNPAATGERFYDGEVHGSCAEQDGVSLVDPSYPVICVSWMDAVVFANALSKAEGLEPCYEIDGGRARWPAGPACLGYRLPTEAEWEYVARSGRTTAFGTLGSSEEALCAAGNLADASARAAWPSWPGVACDDHHAGLAPVGSYAANGFGVHDTLGNVWEWTWDLYGPYSSAEGEDVDPTGAASGDLRVHRGGAWGNAAESVRVGNRRASGAVRRNINLGFRLVRTAG
jgi:formylglycine-generating enzyme required for sulfatase activity